MGGKSKKLKLKLTEALQVCQQCHRLAPFCFYNGNTFAGIARDFVAELNPLFSRRISDVLRSIAGHIVAGTATDIETEQLNKILEELDK